MRPFVIFAVSLVSSVFASPFAVAENGPPAIGNLKCEYLSNPLGVEAVNPRLSWQLQSDRRGVLQTAYQIVVSSRPDKLTASDGDLWDSGKVQSAASIHVPYDGKPLRSHQRCFWRVRVWDDRGNVSAWSQPGRWTMGLLDPSDWNPSDGNPDNGNPGNGNPSNGQATWLSYSKPLERQVPEGSPAKKLTLSNVHWIWSPKSGNKASGQSKTCHFRKAVDLPAGAQVEWAYLQVAATAPFQLFVNGKRISIAAKSSQPWTRAYEVELTERLGPGKNQLALDVTTPDAKPDGLAAKLVVQLVGGERIIARSDAGWKASPHGGLRWQTPGFDDSKWPAADVVGPVGMAPWGTPQPGPAVGWSQKASSPIMRKEFCIAKPIRSAVASICGLGYHELRLNGKKVGDHVLDPAVTRYDRRVLYVAHDVTDRLTQGQNALGVMLGNGWYNLHTRATWDFDRAPWRNAPALLFHLRIEFADGTIQTITSDESWRASTGPVVLDGIRAGEVYDARLEQPGWDTAGFDDSHWDKPSVVQRPAGVVSSQTMPPMRVTQEIEPVSVAEPRPGVFVFDMGQQLPGWARLRVRGPAGARVTMRYSERIDEQGMIERSDIAKYVFEGPFQTDTYILRGSGPGGSGPRGSGTEQWEPRFVYHGFRYLEVTGFPGRPTLENITGCVVHTDFPSAGEFACSNELLNSIQRLTRWSYRGNYHGYPTDCPAREKNGWTGDAHLAAEQAMYNFQNAAAYRKWLHDIRDEQKESGEIPAIIPTGGWGYAWGNGPAWDSAYVLIPWYLYLYNGDSRTLGEHYGRMKRYVDYLTGRSENHIVHIGLGDWVPAKTVTPNAITSTGYYYVDAKIVAAAAKILGKHDDAAKYTALAATIRKSFNREFYKGDGIYLNGSQTAQSCAIHQGLVRPADKAAVVEKLAANVHRADDHLDVGILGAKYLFHSLSENGRHDLAYRIATQTTPPSYGDWVGRGATTLWENWKDGPSRNHVMFGDISAWFYQKLAGINADAAAPGFKHIIIRPMPVGDLTWVRAKTDSMYGTITSSWIKREDGRLELTISIPANTTATVYVPAGENDQVTESPVSEAKLLARKNGYATFQIGSGTYRFAVSPASSTQD